MNKIGDSYLPCIVMAHSPQVKLRDELRPMIVRAYLCPWKYREGRKTLIEQYLAAGQIRPSTSDYVSPAFIVLKADPNVLPH
jgi:hypothetical protein